MSPVVTVVRVVLRLSTLVTSFGKTIRDARERANMPQKTLAALIRKPDGQAISPTYLHDLEQGNRRPPSDALIEQLAAALAVPCEVLYFAAGRLPPELSGGDYEAETIVQAFADFRRRLARVKPRESKRARLLSRLIPRLDRRRRRGSGPGWRTPS